jgi:hypothetical protein
MNEEADMRVPCAKMKVVLPVAKLLRGCRSLGGDRKGVKPKANGEKKKIQSDAGAQGHDFLRLMM